MAVSDTDTSFSEITERTCVHAKISCGICIGIIWTYAVADSFEAVLLVEATVGHAGLVDYLCVVIGRTLFNATQSGLVAKVVRRASQNTLSCRFMPVEWNGQYGTK